VAIPHAGGINVLVAQQEPPAVSACEIVSHSGGKRVAQMQLSGGTGSKTRAHHGVAASLAEAVAPANRILNLIHPKLLAFQTGQ
jgi:hypothetical protein